MVHRPPAELARAARLRVPGVCCLVATLALPAQDPTGRVVDEAGAPIAGARVRVEIREHVVHEYAAALRAALQHRPVPKVLTTRDGSFVLPLLPEHRRLGTGFDPPLVLRIEADGFQTWREPLPFGLAGFVGTHAVLHRLTDADAYDIHVVDPPPGALLWVRRLGDVTLPDDEQVLAVPADGRLRVFAPVLPTPLVRPDWRSTRELGHELQVLAPGHSSARLRLDPDTPAVVIRAATHAHAALTILDEQGTPLAAARGLYRLPDESLRWFPATEGVAPRDDAVVLVAVAAADRLARTVPIDATAIALPRLPSAPLRLTVRDRARPRPDASVHLLPLDEACDTHLAGPRGGAARRLGLDAAGTFTLAAAELQTCALVVEAPRCATRVWLPEEIVEAAGTLGLDAAACGSIQVRVIDAAERPLAGADVRLPSAALDARARPRVARTDERGVCRIDGVRPGQFEILAVGDGVLGRAVVHLRQDDVAEVTVSATGQHLRGIARDDRGQRVPFAPFEFQVPEDPRQRRVRSHTDSLGNIELPFQAGEGSVAFMTDRAPAQVFRSGHLEEVQITPARGAVVQLGPDTVVLRAEFSGAGGTTTEHLRVAASRLLVTAPADFERVDLILAAGPPVVVLASELGRLEHRLPLARREIVRRAPILLTDSLGERVAGAQVINMVGRTLPKVFDAGEQGPVQAIDGGLVWLARDDAEHRLAVFHPEFLPESVIVPAADGPDADAPIRVALTRGAPVSVAMHRLDLKGSLTTMRVTQGQSLILTALVRVPLTVGDDPTVVAQLPCALAPGSYTVHVEQQMEVRRLPVVVVGTEAHVLH